MARIHRNAIRYIYSVEDARAIDRIAIEEKGVAGILLMKSAGISALEALQTKWPKIRQIEVFCGAGNNAGDGYILAGVAADQGLSVIVWELKAPDQLRGDAALAREFAAKTSARLMPFSDYQASSDTDVLVDGLLGTGFKGSLRAPYRSAIEAINDRDIPVLALDVPSGLDANTGWVDDAAVKADITVTFIVAKKGLFTSSAPDFVGELLLDDLNIEPGVIGSVVAPVELICAADLEALVHPRQRTAHKGDFGTVLVIGGDIGFGGAAIMAAEASLRAGAGRVILATKPQHVGAALSRCPELMVRGVEHADELKPILEAATVLVVGPGLGVSTWSRDLLSLVLEADLPTVLDADALNLLCANDSLIQRLNSKCVLTPHPGEAGRLLSQAASEVQKNRFVALEKLLQKYANTFVLKGSGTLVGTPGQLPALCSLGNPGMATAGMGDVLSGLCGALLARGCSSDVAARAAVFVHAAAADQCARVAGEVGLNATDLLAPIRKILNGDLAHV